MTCVMHKRFFHCCFSNYINFDALEKPSHPSTKNVIEKGDVFPKMACFYLANLLSQLQFAKFQDNGNAANDFIVAPIPSQITNTGI